MPNNPYLLRRCPPGLQENVPQAQRFKPGTISAAELRSLADSLRRQSPAAAHRHAALLQLAEAAAAAIEGPHAGGCGVRGVAIAAGKR